MFKNIGLLLILFSVIYHVNSLDLPFVSDVQDLISLAHDVGDIAAGNVPLKGFFVATVNPINVIMDTVNQLVNQVTDLGNQLNSKLDSILNAILVRVPLEGKIDNDMKDIINWMSRVDQKFEDFEVYAEFPEDFSERTLNDYINFIIGTNAGELQDILYSMLLVIVPPRSTLSRASLFENIKQQRNITDTRELCDLDLSFQYRLYKIYNLLMITELKAFIMTQFAYKQLAELDNRKASTTFAYQGELKRHQAKYIMRAVQYQMEIKKILQGSSREIYRCGPKMLVSGEDYVEFERLFQLYVINEVQMYGCGGTCSSMGIVYSHRDSYRAVFNGPFGSTNTYSLSTENKCNGRLRGCEWIGGRVDICENPAGSVKRYQFIRSHSNGYYGRWTDCSTGIWKNTNSYDNSHFENCGVCMCTCLEENAESKAVRTISLRPQLSNIEENKVVSNVRFVSKDGIIHIQIEESSLLSVGILSTNDTAWVPLEDFEYFPNITGNGGFRLKNGDEYKDLDFDDDYIFVTYERNQMNIDEISADSGYVLTGARFNVENPKNRHSPFQLEIHVTPYNFTTGKLTPTDDNPSMWLSAKTQPNPPVEYTQERTKFENDKDMNFWEQVSYTPVPLMNKFVHFTSSSSANGGQSTIPFFDARPVVSVHNQAFNGMGMIYYKSDEGYTGPIALKLMTIDLVPYIKPNLKASQTKFYTKFYRGPLKYNPPSL